MKKVVFSFLLMFVFAAYSFVNAQQKQANISFDKLVHDFGKIKEETGGANYKFSFTNTGSEPLIINNVKASCGCTTPDWSKEPVAPGQKGFISVTYNPKGRPGPINKSITVSSNAVEASVMLRITGEVIAKEKTVEDIYPQIMGDVRLKTNHIAFVKIYNTDIKSDTLDIINMSDQPQTITFEQIPAHIALKVVPATLKGKAKGKIIATYDATKQKDWGFIINRIGMLINGVADINNKTLSISATIEENFSKLSEKDKANAPKIEFENMTFDFKQINLGQSVSNAYKFKNTGKSDLIIRKTKASCGCTAITSKENEIIKPGKTGEIQMTFNSTGKKGKQNKTITVITNDPKQATVILKIVGEVIDPNAPAPNVDSKK